jgi:hypothetical protein
MLGFQFDPQGRKHPSGPMFLLLADRYWVGVLGGPTPLLLNVASAAGRILANFIISGSEHEYYHDLETQ